MLLNTYNKKEPSEKDGRRPSFSRAATMMNGNDESKFNVTTD